MNGIIASLLVTSRRCARSYLHRLSDRSVISDTWNLIPLKYTPWIGMRELVRERLTCKYSIVVTRSASRIFAEGVRTETVWRYLSGSSWRRYPDW